MRESTWGHGQRQIYLCEYGSEEVNVVGDANKRVESSVLAGLRARLSFRDEKLDKIENWDKNVATCLLIHRKRWANTIRYFGVITDRRLLMKLFSNIFFPKENFLSVIPVFVIILIIILTINITLKDNLVIFEQMYFNRRNPTFA